MAATFDGVDDRYQLANETTLRYEYTQAFSGHCWIRKDAVTGNCIMGKAQNAGPQRGWALNTENIGGNLGISFHLVNDNGTAHAFKQAEVVTAGSGNPLHPNLWVAVGFTYNGNGLTSGMTLYSSGLPMTTSGTPVDTLAAGTILVNGVPMRIGGFDTEWWAGTVCGVTLVPAELTAAEMLQLADVRNLFVPPSRYLSTAPSVWLPLRNVSGSVDLTDYSGNGHDASVGSGAPAVAEDPMITFDRFVRTDFTSSTSFTHTPFGNVESVEVMIVQNIVSTDLISAVTYGGLAMTRVPTNGLAQDAAGEPGAAYYYRLSGAIPQGAQTVEVTVASGTDARSVWVVTLNARGRVSLTTSDRQQGDAANPSVTLGTSSTFNGMVLNVLFSGQNAPSSVTAGTGYLKLGGGRDFGSQAAVAQAGNFVGASLASGWTSTSEDVAMIAVALEANQASLIYNPAPLAHLRAR